MLGVRNMYALRQIYHTPPETIAVPESMRHQVIEVIFMQLDEPAPASNSLGLGTLALQLFSQVEHEGCGG